jgi:curved DNA-binding protein CbpA
MISAHKNYYQILGLSLSATPDEIKKSYRKLAMKYHPDHNPKRRSAEERFKLLQQAYEVLSDPETRTQYDRTLAEGPVDELESDESVVSDWRLSWLGPYIVPFLIGAAAGSLGGFAALVYAYVYILPMDSWVWGVFFIGGGAIVGGVAASIYFTQKSFY